MQPYPQPTGGASLILAFRPNTTLVIGSGQLAATRTFAALETGSTVVLASKGPAENLCDELQWRLKQGEIVYRDLDSGQSTTDEGALLDLLDTLPRIPLACITDTVSGSQSRRSKDSARRLYQILKAKNIQVNTADIPELCDYTFTSTHRFVDPESQEASPLQIGVTTNGEGCRLAARVRREIVAKLPSEVGTATKKVGTLRSLAKASVVPVCSPVPDAEAEGEGFDEIEEDSTAVVTTPNRPVPSRVLSPTEPESEIESARRRMKWVAQVSEYWPLPKLAALTKGEMDDLLDGRAPSSPTQPPSDPSVPSLASALSEAPSVHDLFSPDAKPKLGRIYLVGSGPGHPSLLTIATHTVLTKIADVVLSDKLVPAAVLALIPKHVEVRIARKFPGNAEAAQNEMMEMAVEAAAKGLDVVRLKQGDPVVYGRAGEEVLYFRARGIEPLVIPGVSSALAAPTFAGIPVTQRGVAESLIVCTGVGRLGKEITLPGYERGRTLVILMGVARLAQVVESLTAGDSSKRRDGPAYPLHTPIAIIERASMPDQRVVTSTLGDIVQALESSGEQRPPGMILVGWSVLALHGKGDVTVLEKGEDEGDRDQSRVEKWLGGGRWRVETGIDEKWDLL